VRTDIGKKNKYSRRLYREICKKIIITELKVPIRECIQVKYCFSFNFIRNISLYKKYQLRTRNVAAPQFLEPTVDFIKGVLMQHDVRWFFLFFWYRSQCFISWDMTEGYKKQQGFLVIFDIFLYNYHNVSVWWTASFQRLTYLRPWIQLISTTRALQNYCEKVRVYSFYYTFLLIMNESSHISSLEQREWNLIFSLVEIELCFIKTVHRNDCSTSCRFRCKILR